jgi:hypothetical protein
VWHVVEAHFVDADCFLRNMIRLDGIEHSLPF